MATAPLKLAALAVAIVTAVALSSLFHYQCRHLPTPFVSSGTHRLIVVSNEQEVGEEMDLADGSVELRCQGFSEHDRRRPVWNARATIPSGTEANLTFPAVHGDEVFEVLCSYRGANRCWAHGVQVFLNPGHDNLFCSEQIGGCTVRFRKDGGVEKVYEANGQLDDVQPAIFMGFVPDFDNARDGACASASCVGRTINRVIGQESCCDDSCERRSQQQRLGGALAAFFLLQPPLPSSSSTCSLGGALGGLYGGAGGRGGSSPPRPTAGSAAACGGWEKASWTRSLPKK